MLALVGGREQPFHFGRPLRCVGPLARSASSSTYLGTALLYGGGGEREGTEARYLAKLVRMVRHDIASGELRSSRDGAYFVVRVSVIMTDLCNATIATDIQALS